MNPIIKKSTDWIKSHKKTAISLSCVTIAVIVAISTITIIEINNNKLESNALASSSSSENNLSSDSSLDESSSSLNEGDIHTNNSDNSSATETTSSSNLTSTGGNSTSSTPSKQPTPPTLNGGNSSTKPTPPTPPTSPKPTPPPPPKPPTPPPVAQRTWEYMPSLSRQTFDLMNKFRQDNGVAPLKWNETCNRRAKKIAEGNAKEQVIYHEEGQIALNNSTGTAESFIKQWSDSDKGHKQSMLQILYTGGAVAVYKDSNGRFYVVTDFWNDLFE